MRVHLGLIVALIAVVFAGCMNEAEPRGEHDVCIAIFPPPAECEQSQTPEPVVNPTPEPAPVWPHYPNDGNYSTTEVLVESSGGHMVPITIYKPALADNQTQFPVLLYSHGFTGNRFGVDSRAADYVAAGFGLVAMDQRGHGDARDNSSITFMHPEAEVLDVIAVIDEIATLDWVLLDGEGDPRLGTIGGSYGGAFQLMTSLFDDRIDAMVPEITWNNILEALAPNGAIKSGWVDLFYAAGNARQTVTFSEEFHRGFAYATASNEMPSGQLPEIPDLASLFLEASPESYDKPITIPTLLVQGMPDTLFPLNHAVANYDRLQDDGAPVHLYTHLGGHVLSASSYGAPENVPGGLQGAAGSSPCGVQKQLDIQWHQKWLLELPIELGPPVCIALENETAIQGDTFPLPSTEMMRFDEAGPYPIAQAPAGAFVPISLMVADEDLVIAGIGNVTASLLAPGADTIVYFSLQVLRADGPEGLMEQYVSDQVMPIRLAGPNTTEQQIELDLGGVGTKLTPGDELFLVVANFEPMYFSNAQRLPSAATISNISVHLPVVTEPVPYVSVGIPITT